MKFFFILAIFVLLQNCSFDNKSGIWENEDQVINKKENKLFKEFEDLNNEQKIFNKIIKSNQKIKLYSKPKSLNELNDHSLDKINTLNLSYKGLNEQIFRSKKISKNKINKKIFFDNDNLILSDVKGNIIIYSTKEKKYLKNLIFTKKLTNQ